MKTIEKRIEELENRRAQRKAEGAWLAFIYSDGTVNLSHIKRNDIFLNSREQLHEFIDLHDLGRFDLIIVDHATCQGPPPKEL